MMGAPIPDDDELPPTIRAIFRRNVAHISDGLNLLDNITRIMEGFEVQIAERGAAREVANPVSQATLTEVQQAGGKLNIPEVLKRFAAAQQAGDLPQALVWLAELRGSGQAVPATFRLAEREAALQQRLREEEERRRRREVADFQYEFIRTMVMLNDEQDLIRAAIDGVWQVEADYIPDDLHSALKWLRPAVEPARTRVLDILPAPFAWIDIPAGAVSLVENYDDKSYFGSKGEPKRFDVPKFQIAKYPVTNAQFQVFVDALDGYHNAAWWDYSADAKKWRASNSQPQDPAFAGDDHPRANVTWYEAVAFSRWLGSKLGVNIHLPSEQQWQRPAQGDTDWAYPWSNEWDCKKCNNGVDPCDSNSTSSVTAYEGIGDSPFGVVDMSGNVWEWCLTDYNNGSQDVSRTSERRVLRGGAWLNNNSGDFRADYRSGGNSDYRSFTVGFRCALSSE